MLNELTDIHAINAQILDDVKADEDYYVYANYLQSGIHKFLIYCPSSFRAYVKTVAVGVNTKDHYPEYPR